MVLRIALGVVLGGGVGLAVGYFGKSMGGQCPLACNPYVSTGIGVMLGLILVSRTSDVEALARNPSFLRLGSAEEYHRAVAGSKLPLLIELYTRSCPHCARQMPVLDTLARRYAGRLTVAVANVRDLPEVAADESIRAVPAGLLVVGGAVVERFAGWKSAEELTALVGPYLTAHGVPGGLEGEASP